MWGKISILTFIISACQDNFSSATSEFEFEYPGNDIDLGILEAPIDEAGVDRDLQACVPAHAGNHQSRSARYGSNMFYDEEIWTTPDVKGPMVLRWDLVSCQMKIGIHILPDQSFVYVRDGSSSGFIYDNVEAAYNHMHTDTTATYRAVFSLDSSGNFDTPARSIVRNGVQQVNWPSFNMDPNEGLFEFTARQAVSLDSFQFVWEQSHVAGRLLKGSVAETKMGNTIDTSANVFARLVNKEQIRIVNNGFYYLTRKSVHGTSSGLLQSTNFFNLHNETGGGMNPSFSICENIGTSTPLGPVSASAEVGLCCGTQCTGDMSKVSKSTLCDVSVSNCYNPLLENCTVDTLHCEHVIAEPADQLHALFPSTRSSLPEDNIWTYYGRYDFVGGMVTDNNYGVKTTSYVSGSGTYANKNAEARVSIPFSGSGTGNGRYEIEWNLAVFQSYSSPRNVGLLEVHSYSTGETLASRTVSSAGLFRNWTPITFEVTIADRHLNDIGFAIRSINNRYLDFDYVAIKYLHHETLSPTPYPTPNPTPRPTPAPTPSVCSHVDLTVLTDQRPQEISWEWKESDGTVRQYAPTGYYGIPNRSYSHALVACTGKCYRFNVYDTGHNGLCCSNGSGYVRIVSRGQTRFVKNSYNYSWTHVYCH